MILKALSDYYDILNKAGLVSSPGYSSAKVSFVLVISKDGNLTNIVDIRTDGKKKQPVLIEVPYQQDHSTTIDPHFVCDNVKYVFGVESKDEKIIVSKRSTDCFEKFRSFQHSLLDSVNDVGVKAYLKFLDGWKPELFLTHSKTIAYGDDIVTGGNLIFECDGKYIHDNPLVKTVWVQYDLIKNGNGKVAQCLVSGKQEVISRLHQKIKNIDGGQAQGASLVGFNDESFCSYGKEQGDNAPISELTMFKYTTALNYLLRYGSKNRIVIGDATIVFWAETDKKCEDLVSYLINPFDKKDENEIVDEDKEDHKIRQTINDVFQKIKEGKPLEEKDLGVDPVSTNFYILGLIPNAGRISICYWYHNTFGNFVKNVMSHYLDMEIENNYNSSKFVSMYRLLKQTVPSNSKERASSPLLGGLLMRSIVNNMPYPVMMYNAILNRIRVERSVTYVRAGFIKAYLIRHMRVKNEEQNVITMSLNKESQNVPYRLGRLFALFESVQRVANPGITNTISDNYFSSAAFAPASVYPILLKSSQHHLSKIGSDKMGLKIYFSKAIGDIMSSIDEFPMYMNLENQGMFMLGYYHQKNFRETKENDVVEEKMESES